MVDLDLSCSNKRYNEKDGEKLYKRLAEGRIVRIYYDWFFSKKN
jgi:hypothetical protein